MTQQIKNLRLRRTQTLLREALIALIEERGFEALTIGEITERAMVSRAAFYRNYQDKYDLVEQIFEEAMSALLDLGEVFRAYCLLRTALSSAAWQEGQPLVCEEDARLSGRPG
jgi:AcrR family transcriptional regulator